MERFKEPEFLERVFIWVNAVLDLTGVIPNTPIGRNIRYQLIKSCTSVGANLEEADSAYSRNEFNSFTNIAKREAKESLYWMKILKYRKMVQYEDFPKVFTETEEMVKILFTIVKNSQGKAEN